MHIFIMDMMNSFGYIGIALLIYDRKSLSSYSLGSHPDIRRLYDNLYPFDSRWSCLFFHPRFHSWRHLSLLHWEITLSGKIRATYRWKARKNPPFQKIRCQKIDQKIPTKGNMTVFICRCIPILRSLISIPAGMSNMKMGNFLVLTIAGSALWNTILVSAGAAAGASWEKILEVMDTYSTVVVIIIGLSMFFGCFFYYRNRKNES